MKRSKIAGIGYYVPERIVTNQELTHMMDTTDEWIQERTGIRERRYGKKHEETTASMGAVAARIACERAGIRPEEIDFIVFATLSPDYYFPGCGVLLQRELGITFLFVTHDQEEALSMSDRVVVMNHGVIEQVGTPLDVYERPATPFVADFLGKVNVLKATALGAGRYRVGSVELSTGANGATAGQAVRLYLRPEDRVLSDAGAVETMANALTGTVRNLDFLGTYCLASFDVDGFDGQRMVVYFSLNQTLELGVAVGARLAFALRGDRVRVFNA